MDGCINYFTYEFLTYVEEYKIVICPLPTHTSHILQFLDVVIFQPLKHWHAEAIFEAAFIRDDFFNK